MQEHRKLISIIIALVASFALWAYTVAYVSPKSSMDYSSIPVVLRDEDVLKARGLILTSGRDNTASITVSGNRSDLLKLSSENIKLSASLSNINSAGSWDITYNVSYPDTVANGDLAVESRKPGSVKVEVSLATTKALRPVLNVIGEPGEGALLDSSNLSCDVETVTIYGPSSEVDPIKKVQVDVNVSNMTSEESRAMAYHLLDENNNEVELSDLCTITLNRREGSDSTGDDVLVYIPVRPYKELYLRPNYINAPSGIAVDKCTFKPTKITVVGNSQALAEQADELDVDVDLSAVTTQQGTWDVHCVVSLNSGLVAYVTPDGDFDGINVNAVIKTRPLPQIPTATGDAEEPAENG